MDYVAKQGEFDQRTALGLAAAAVVAVVAFSVVSVVPVGDAWVTVSAFVGYQTESFWPGWIIGMYGAAHTSMWTTILTYAGLGLSATTIGWIGFGIGA